MVLCQNAYTTPPLPPSLRPNGGYYALATAQQGRKEGPHGNYARRKNKLPQQHQAQQQVKQRDLHRSECHESFHPGTPRHSSQPSAATAAAIGQMENSHTKTQRHNRDTQREGSLWLTPPLMPFMQCLHSPANDFRQWPKEFPNAAPNLPC